MAEQEDEKSRHMAFGYCSYSDVQPTHLVSPTQLQGFEPSSEIYSLTSGIEMIGFQPKTLFLDKPGPAGFPSASSMVAPHSMSWQENHHSNNNRPLVGEESSIRCVFPCEGNERPSQGLSLSLSSSNPSTIGLQTFELRHTHQHQGDFRLIAGDGFCGTSAFEEHDQQQQQHVVIQEQGQSELGGQFHQLVRSSKYLAPAQELLNEFCCLGIIQDRHDYDDPQKQNQKLKQANSRGMWGGEDDATNNINSNSTACGSNSISRHQQASLYALDLIELQKRKKKFLAMLDELERRYKHYCNQMKAVVGSFEMVAGEGTASPYTVLASKAMSKHFRCLRDGIAAQIKATKAAMGEKDSECGSHGATKGETPRLRILDQTLRQHRALQQMGMVESHPWRPQRGLPERAVSVLRAWLFEHFLHPYPSDVDKHILARQTGLTRSQVSNWFINARVRLWKPMVEEMYIEELKEDEPSDAHVATGDQGGSNPDPHDQKPCHDQLLRFESESLSSIVSTSTTRNSMMMRNPSSHHEGFGRVAIEGFGGPMDSLDLSSYGNHEGNFGIGGSVRGVSLTLGLQQHGGVGHLLYGKEEMEDAQQYSLLEGDDQINEPQNLPYMNLQLGAHLLHDFA